MKVLAYAALLATVLFSATSARALEEQIRPYRGLRSTGMGGLVTTTGNYSEALFGNPARHSEVDTWKWSILDISLEVNDNLLNGTGDLQTIKGGSGASTITGATKLIGKNEHARAQVMLAYYNPQLIGDLGFAFGLLASVQTNLIINFTTDIDTQTVLDIGPHMGFSHPFFDNTLSLGFNLHFPYRVASDGLINSLNLLTGGKLSLQNFGKQGFGLDADIGAYYHIPWEIPFMRISLGMSVNGLAKSHYADVQATLLANVGERPINNDRVFNAGIRFDFPDFMFVTAPLFAFEVQDTGDTQKRISFAKKTHMGFEGKLSRVFSFRTGLNQGYLAAGIGVDLPVVKMDVATYGEELAGNAGQLEDRRVAFRLAFEL